MSSATLCNTQVPWHNGTRYFAHLSLAVGCVEGQRRCSQVPDTAPPHSCFPPCHKRRVDVVPRQSHCNGLCGGPPMPHHCAPAGQQGLHVPGRSLALQNADADPLVVLLDTPVTPAADPLTMRFDGTAKVLAKLVLKYYRMSYGLCCVSTLPRAICTSEQQKPLL